MDKCRRVAVVGSGISGAIAAWLLRDTADVTLFESEHRYGGHTHTVAVPDGDAVISIDTGFMVFNRPNYPLLSALFDHLGVETYPTDMSFSASFEGGELEYAGSDLNTLFGQRRNLVSPRFWGVLLDILRFNRAARQAVRQPPVALETLDNFLDRNGLGREFRIRYLYPMAAAIWSCPRDEIGRFPAFSFIRFFANHGLISLSDRPQWHTVDGGASIYMARLIDDLGPRARRGEPVLCVRRTADGVALHLDEGRVERFDEVILACHSDQALSLLADPSPSERAMLAGIPYQANRVLLHRDDSLMPRERRVWSSWNYFSGHRIDGRQAVSVTYWMNSLQRLATRNDYFVSLNPLHEPEPGLVVEAFEYHHPVFGLDALRAQRRLAGLQGRDRLWFAGAWTGYGFHEDGMRSGVEVAQALGARVPWAAEAHASRELALLPQLAGQAA